jgi:hypothetical protein
VSATTSASPPAPVTVPGRFAGSWSGQATQPGPSVTFSVSLSLDAGSSRGRVTYGGSFSCAGELIAQSSAHGTLTLRQRISRGRKTCANGTVTLAVGPAGTLRFSFRGQGGPAATGTLTRLTGPATAA